MALDRKLHRPWLIAVWPGMGHVAISAGYYQLSKLGMELFAELSPQGLFDVEYVEVKRGVT
jgi:proteasome assembly chaperone (PAC2) family protein